MREFESLNHPEPDEDGVQRYDMFEVTRDPVVGKHWTPVARNLTAEQMEEFVKKNGKWSE